MSLEHNESNTQEAWYTIGLRQKGPGPEWTWTHWDLGTCGLVHKVTSTQGACYTVVLEHNGTGTVRLEHNGPGTLGLGHNGPTPLI